MKTYLFEVVDENGVPFHLLVNEDRKREVQLVKFLAKKCRDTVICADGMIRLPFVQNGPQGFRFFGITGSYNGDPQIWHLPDDKEKNFKLAIAELDRLKRREREQQA